MREGAELRFWRAAVRLVWRAFGTLEVRGSQHVPPAGPALLLSNHQSVLDPFFVQAACRRALHPMTKSTQFASPAFRFIMPHFNAFPVRRYRIDPQAVRVALRRLGAGCVVHIYIEGERTWDGRVQEPRPGAIRLALKAGVPVIPCAVAGAYEAWPRWGRGVRPARVRVTFLPPIRLPRVDRRAEREAMLPETTHRIVTAIDSALEIT